MTYYIICPRCGEVISTNTLVEYEHCPSCNERYLLREAKILKSPAFDIFGMIGLLQAILSGCIITRVISGAAPAFDIVFGFAFMLLSFISVTMSEHYRRLFEAMIRCMCKQEKKKGITHKSDTSPYIKY